MFIINIFLPVRCGEACGIAIGVSVSVFGVMFILIVFCVIMALYLWCKYRKGGEYLYIGP